MKGLVVCAALVSSAPFAVAQSANEGEALAPRLLPRLLPEGGAAPADKTAPKVAQLTLQGAEPVMELNPRLLPIPKKD